MDKDIRKRTHYIGEPVHIPSKQTGKREKREEGERCPYCGGRFKIHLHKHWDLEPTCGELSKGTTLS